MSTPGEDKIGPISVQQIEIPAPVPFTVQEKQPAKLKMWIGRNPVQPWEELPLHICIATAAADMLLRWRYHPSCLLLLSAWPLLHL